MNDRPQRRVLVLDGHLRHALAIVRSLGRRGIPVVVASHERHFPARYSRYVEGTAVLPRTADEKTLERLMRIISRDRIGVAIAAGLPGNALLSRYRRELEPLVRAPFNDYVEFERLSDKRTTVALATSLGVRCPSTKPLHGVHEAAHVAAEIGFPLVFKSPIDQGTVRYARSVEELKGFVREFASANPELIATGVVPIAQEYVEGTGHGFFGLADRGRLSAYFMHRRVHEVPPSGGPSAMAMGYRDSQLLELGARFFSATAWTGVAMVEFKRTADGSYYVLEVNPKFWGSLDLSIAAGVDFPYLLYRLLIGDPIAVQPGCYDDRSIFRWLTMDLAYAATSHQLRSYVRVFADGRIEDDLDRSDLLPTAALFARGLTRLKKPTGNEATPSLGSAELARRAFYLTKPLIPRRAQITARRVRAQRIWTKLGRDPSARIPQAPLDYQWPDQCQACALITHDVETEIGQCNAGALLDIERAHRVPSCWNFVVRRYPVDTALIADLRRSGCEIGVHGVYHDGKMFDSLAQFNERLTITETAGRSWGAGGFRSPSLIYDRAMLRALPFAWDSSMPAWDPFQPKPGDCHTYLPFPLSDRCVELPVTLWQDFTLFEELRMSDIAVWRQQIDAIYSIGGLINVIVHPDYMLTSERLDLYRALIEHLGSKERLWITTPCQVAAWERHRS